jgi:hypothetical protein
MSLTFRVGEGIDIGRFCEGLASPVAPASQGQMVCTVFGVNGRRFVDEHRTVGYSIAHLERGEPLPHAVTAAPGGTANVSSVTEMLMSAISYDFSLVRTIIDADLSAGQFDEIMQFKINGGPTCTFISQALNSAAMIRQLTNLTRISEAYRFRVSFLLSSIFRNDSAIPLPKTLFSPVKLTAFHHTVAALNLTSLYRVALLPVIRDQARLLQTINRLYLLSTLLSVMRVCQNRQWYRDAIDPCRELSREVGKTLVSRVDQLRPAGPGSDAYSALLMIFSLQSVQLSRMLLGRDFLKGVRPRLLIGIENSPTVGPAARAVLLGVA